MMIRAVKNRNYNKLRILIEQEHNVNEQNSDGNTPLIFAVKKGLHRFVKLLLDQPNIDIDQINVDGNTALIFAIENSNLKMVKLLVEAGADVNQANQIGNNITPLMYAIQSRSITDIPVYLIQAGANVNAVNTSNQTVLFYACEGTNLKLTEVLLSVGADVNVVDVFGRTALFYPVRTGNIDMIYLLANGTNLDVRRISRSLMEDYINYGKQNYEVFELLIHLGLDVNVRITRGNIPLIFRMMIPNLFKHVEFLLTVPDLDINVYEPANGNTILMFACTYGNIKFVKMLISRGAKINIENDVGLTAPMIASRNDHLVILDYFLNNTSINPNYVSRTYKTIYNVATDRIQDYLNQKYGNGLLRLSSNKLKEKILLQMSYKKTNDPNIKGGINFVSDKMHIIDSYNG